MAYKKKNVQKRRRVIVRKSAAAKAVKPSKRFTKMVKTILHKNAETKQNSTTLGLTTFNSGVTFSGDVLRVLPTIQQGVQESERIGDTITGQKIDIRGHFMITVTPTQSNSGGSFNNAIPANARLMIRAFICSVKKYQNYDDVISNFGNWSGNFLKNGSSSQALDGTLQSMYLPVNTDVITVHKEIKKYITVPVINTAFTPVSPTTYALAAAYDPTPTVKFFNANIKCKKTFKYDDSSFSPQNYAPFMVISYAHLDGSSPDVVTTAIQATFVSTLFFEDV